MAYVCQTATARGVYAATFTPGPGTTPQATVTPLPMGYRTPIPLGGGYGACPPSGYAQGGLDSRWAAACHRCLVATVSPNIYAVPSYTFQPFITWTAQPTGTQLNPTVTPTYTITPTATPVTFRHTFDFSVNNGGWSTIANWPGGGTAGAVYSGGAWNARSPGGYAGSNKVLWLAPPAYTAGYVGASGVLGYASVISMKVWFTQSGMTTAYWPGFPASGSPYTLSVNDAVNAGWFTFQWDGNSSSYGSITKIEIHGYGLDPWTSGGQTATPIPSATSTGTITPTVTPTPFATIEISLPLMDCSTPLYENYEDPLLTGVDLTSDIPPTCFTVIPRFELVDPPIQEVRVCFQWISINFWFGDFLVNVEILLAFALVMILLAFALWS